MDPNHLALLFARADCVTDCPTESPQCNCAADESCLLIPRTCSKCAYVSCTPGPNSGGGGVNPGIIAGPIIAVALVACSVGLFLWLRRKKRRDLARLEDLAERARKGESSALHLSQPGSPASRSRHVSQIGRTPVTGAGLPQQRATLPNVPADAEYYDENGATIRVYTGKRGVINADPNHPDNGGSGDPFADSRSMSTAGSGNSTNVIPIHYVPAAQSDDTLAQVLQNHRGTGGPPATVDQQAAAARTLDLARQNLFRPGNGVIPPPRPARAPDLDLRLNPPRPMGNMNEANSSRSSVGSFNSASPSFLSTNTSDVHLDTPKIVTRQQVHVGRLQAAEVIHISSINRSQGPSSQENSTATNPFAGDSDGSRNSMDSRRFDDDGNAISQPSPTDLRFSMGSLAFDDRASMSTTGTGGHHLPPVPPFERTRFESISSSHSAGGESLGNFPMMITPASNSSSLRSLGAVPQNMSTSTLDAAPGTHPSRPPVSFKGDGRPLTNFTTGSTHSVTDSFFGSFVPPQNLGADNQVAAPGAGAVGRGTPGSSRLTGMSTMSEGLGGFEFNFDGQGDDNNAAGSKELVEDPTTPRAPTGQHP